jgi:hypothetical protein
MSQQAEKETVTVMKFLDHAYTALIAVIFVAIVAALVMTLAKAEEQTRVYAPDGRSVGTIVPQREGTLRYYDSRGNSLGTSTTVGNTTTFYGPGGSVTGKAVLPFRGGRR